MDGKLILSVSKIMLIIVNPCATLLSEVHMNNNITANIYSDGIVLSCSFNVGDGDKLVSTIIAAQNSTIGTFGHIAGFEPDEKPRLTSFGELLFANETTVLHFEKSNNTFSLTFDNLTCRKEGLYKCILIVLKNFEPRFIESDVTSISVKVHPTNPVISMLKKDNNSSDPRNNNTDSTNGKRTEKSTALSSKKETDEIAFKEGDNVTFFCAGNVGRPKGKLVWQKIYSKERTFNYTNTTTETTSDICSSEENSTLTIQVTGDDNQAIIRCIMESEVSTVNMYADSKPLFVHFKVRKPSIALLPNETVFPVGHSVELHCKTYGNPNPSYTWIKGNTSNEPIVDKDIFVIENANISDSGLYTCNTSNSIDGIVHSEYVSTYIDIADRPTTSNTTFRPVRSNNTEVTYGVYVGVIVGVILVLLIAGVIYACTKRHTNKAAVLENIQTQNYNNKYAEMENNDTNSEDNQQQEDTYEDAPEDFYDKAGDRRHKEPTNCEPFDHTGTAQDISAESNEPTERNDSTIMLSCYPKSHNQSKSSGYESVEMDGVTPVLLSKSNGNEQADAELIKQHNEKYLQNQKEEDEKVNKSPGSHQHVEYAQIDETKKLKNKNKQNDQETIEKHEETTFESEEMHPKTDVNVDHFDKPNIKKSLTSSENTKQEENRNAETRQEIHERSGRTVDNAQYFDTASHLESLASSEDNKQKENKNARTPLGNQESWNRTIENAEYFDTTHLEKQHNHKDPDTAIRNDQTTLYINQAFDGKDNQEEDTVSSPVQILHGLQEDEKSNQNNDKQSKHDYENVNSTAQPESSNGDTIH